mmetsp:Transcript_35125/g.74921  ORF Transcript_35125/g.74921 Transcript_35125/m.74921 type:complete len:122 (-) Transcript_35125:146-511(-)
MSEQQLRERGDDAGGVGPADEKAGFALGGSHSARIHIAGRDESGHVLRSRERSGDHIPAAEMMAAGVGSATRASAKNREYRSSAVVPSEGKRHHRPARAKNKAIGNADQDLQCACYCCLLF